MKIRIDPHLERFEVISQLKKLIMSYNKDVLDGKYQDQKYSFSDYIYERSLDPVKRFLLLCINSESLGEDTNYDDMINYYSSKFQSYRGTLKIFEYLDEISDVLGVRIKKDSITGKLDYKYDIHTLEINFEDVETIDINLFISAAEEFFKSLFYFQEYVDAFDTLQFDLTSDLFINLSGGAKFYSSYTVTEEDI